MPDLTDRTERTDTGARVAVRVQVSGHVQGVFFRDSTRQVAREHGVSGWVRNDPEGTVTALLEGAPADVEAVVEWMRAGGPPRASVHEVRTGSVDAEGREGFTVRH